MTSQHKITQIRQDFPIFSNVTPYGKPLTYLDNAASSQKPTQVIKAIEHSYMHDYANVHRGLHYLANQATEKFEAARQKVQHFLGAQHAHEIIWTSGATEAINLAAHAIGAKIQSGDEIILSISEHHSNIIPWHFLREKYGAVIRWVNLNPDGSLDMAHYESLLNEKTKIVAITHMSNILGTINDIQKIAKLAHTYNAYILADGSQACVHFPVNVTDLGVDFYVLTGHKLYGPTGIGALYIQQDIANTLPPFQGGGEMIDIVTKDSVTYNTPPHRFEAGTPQIIQAIGLGAAIDYIHQIGFDTIEAHEKILTQYIFEQFSHMKQITIFGTTPDKGSVFSFNVDNIHPHDLATYLDRQGIAIRAGHHCGQILMQHLNVSATARASCALYNTTEDIDLLCENIQKAVKFFN